MNNNEHPITPPPELVQQWHHGWKQLSRDKLTDFPEYMATQAARWGADQELEACIEAVLAHPGFESPELFVELLRAARRPKPPSLKEQALEAQQRMWDGGVTREDWELVRRALEQLDD